MKKYILIAFLLVNVISFPQVQHKSLYLNENIISKEEKSLSILSSTLTSNNLLKIETQERKNPALAILFSALLPGMGELYAGSYRTGKYFTIADAAFWGTFIGLNVYSNWKEDNYKSFAVAKGSVNSTNKSKDYYSLIANYSNIEQYNEEKALNREFGEMLDPNVDYWKWETESDRREYRGIWLDSKNTDNNLNFVVAALILNRVASIINAVRLVSNYNNDLENTNNLNFYFDYNKNSNIGNSVSFNLIKSF
ncbi:MAG: hypothetical protein STSR0008_22470 [Ignavibacterium sp.]